MLNLNEYRQWLKEQDLSPNTIQTYHYALKRFPASINTPNLRTYLQTNLQKYEPTTLTLYRQALKSYSKFSQLKIDWTKTARLIPKIQRKFFETINESELNQLKATQTEANLLTHQRNNLILDFLFYSGLRVSELVAAKHHHWQGNSLKVYGKGNQVRYVFLPDFLIKQINPYSLSYIFTTPQNKPIPREWISQIIKKRTLEAGLKKRITPHTFRRSFATLLNSRGAKLTTIQRLLGHTNLETTVNYIHNSYEELYQDYSKLWRNSPRSTYEI